MFYYFMFYKEDNLLFKVIKKLDNKKSKNLIFYGDINLNSEIIEFNDCLITDGNEYKIFYLSKHEKVFINEEGLCIETKTKIDKKYIEKIVNNPFIFFE